MLERETSPGSVQRPLLLYLRCQLLFAHLLGPDHAVGADELLLLVEALDQPTPYLIAGARGSLAVPTMRLKVYTGERSWWEPFREDTVHVDRADPLARQLEHFCSVIRGEAQALVSGREGLQTLRVTLAIHEAARTERPVRLPLTQGTAVTTDKEAR